jgi:hypothetical protein
MDATTKLELVVFLTALVTTAFALWSLVVSHTDHLVLRRLQENGLKHLTLTARLVRDIARVACAGVMLGGAWACLSYPPNHPTAVAIMKVTVLCTSLFLSVAVISDFRWRARIDAALRLMDETARRP